MSPIEKFLYSFFLLTIATSVGLIIFIFLMKVSDLTLESIINTIFPPTLPERTGGFLPFPSNFGEYIIAYLTVYLLSVCVGSFVSGFLLGQWGIKTDIHLWQVLVSGFIVGASSPFSLLISSNAPPINNIKLMLVVGIPASFIGLIGYVFGSTKWAIPELN